MKTLSNTELNRETERDAAESARDPDLYARELALAAQRAARRLAIATGAQKDAWLRRAATLLETQSSDLLAANARDLEAAPGYGLSPAEIDRLTLNQSRLAAIARALHEIVLLPNPVGDVIDSNIRPNGLRVMRVRVPLGVVFFIYESRPNVTIDAAALCVKSGNAVVLRGGKEALHSNQALAALLQQALVDTGLPRECVQLVQSTDRRIVGSLLRCHEQIAVTIPRGGKSLIERVMAEATMPVIKHYDGICHVYLDESADPEMAERITLNSKCQRPGVCNAAETLLVHASLVPTLLPRIGKALQARGVELRACPRAQAVLPDSRAATDDDFRTEYLDLKMSIKVVDSLEDAMTHIDTYGSHHTETIITQNYHNAQTFLQGVDSAGVLVNASTRLNDGGEFGLGAEIGISTDKFHARGPCGLRELTSYKFIAMGDGQIRE